MKGRGWWIPGAALTMAIVVCGALWAQQSRIPQVAVQCTSCNARHQGLADRRAELPRISPAQPLPKGVSE